MADAIAVFPPGYRLTDNTTGATLSGAVLRFYDAGTTTPKIVYADSELTTELGTSVTCDSLGYPTSNGTTKTQIYVGTADYKIRIETSTGVEIVTHDNVKGAVIADAGGSSGSVIVTRPVVTKSLDYTILEADQNTIFAGNCSSGDVIFTLPSAVTVGDGWQVTIQHAGSANQCVLATVSSQTISEGSKSFGTGFTLSLNGESLNIVSDGGNWRVVDHTSAFFKPGQGVITIADRTNTPPGSPVQGAAYIVTSSPTGAWSAYTLHDIAYYTGAGWINFTPTSDAGWLAYVQDEDIYYRFVGTAWAAESATTSMAGTVRLADQTAMEAETAGRGVTADVLKHHPGIPKAWIVFNGTGTPAIIASYNVSSITDNGVGDYTINFTTAFASTNYACIGSARYTAAGVAGLFGYSSGTTKTTSAMRIGVSVSTSGGALDSAEIAAAFYGDQ